MPHTKAKNDLLIELGTEELPAKGLESLATTFVNAIVKALDAAELPFEAVESFVTPRRIAMLITDLQSQQPKRTIIKRGPAKTAALDASGAPSKAFLGFAASCGVEIEALQLQETDKGAWYVFEQQQEGKHTETLIPQLVKEAIHNLPLPKRMRWGNNSFSFIRPIHWAVLLFGNTTIKTDIFDIESDCFTQGHRFHHPQKIPLLLPKDYEDTLFKVGKVRANFAKRKQHILNEISIQAARHQGTVQTDEQLLDEVTGLVEWPVVLVGQFESSFLNIPKEALISAMKVHQKCFPLIDDAGSLMPKFIIISNIESKDPNTVIQGNESVMHARLSDAAFYFNLDQELSLEKRCEGLKEVVFQHGLGTLWDKSGRIATLAKMLSSRITHENFKKNDDDLSDKVSEAARLCKADLLTQMVGEFPELQGIMGRYYALNDGKNADIAQAIEEHYHPRSATDTLPNSIAGSVLAIADRADTLVGLFGLGKKPTGDKDPFGMRRAALGILRIIIENQFKDIDLNTLFVNAKQLYEQDNKITADKPLIPPLLEFCFERLRAWYLEQGISPQVFESVLAKWPTKPYDFHCRIQAVSEFQKHPEAESLKAANKRVQNILSKNALLISPEAYFDEKLLQEPAERELAQALLKKELEIKPYLKDAQYTKALGALAELKEPIDQFFDKVMVMVEDEKIRNNRLRLLNRLRALFLEIADISL